jgi:hypothetical protein
MADDVQRQEELTKALERATRLRNGADTRWRVALAEAFAAGVPRDVILKACGWDVIEVEDILLGLDEQGSTGSAAPAASSSSVMRRASKRTRQGT